GLVARAGSFRGWPLRRLFIAAVLISVGAALDELHQLFIPGRDCSATDWLADTVGASLGLWASVVILKSKWHAWLE
ncbi:MAG TPA: VanZ family protein, partial [Dongiaceae bacterium]|nr:VanZ family protein [Dongiaceae bacterium]